MTPGHLDEWLDRLLAVTDASLGRLDVPALLTELLAGVRAVLAADTAAVLLLDASGGYLEATAAQGLEEEVHQGVRIPLGRGFAGTVAQRRQSVILDRVDQTTVANPILWEKGLRSMLGVPLFGPAGVIGVLHVGRLSGQPFVEADADLLEVVAERVSGAVQNRRLAVEQTAAALLERSLMPTALPRVHGLEVAARYVTAERGVGGDWYDAFHLPDGQFWLVAGDVAGHGLPAAVIMGRVKSTLRAYALLGGTPGEVLSHTDQKIQHFEPGAMVTVVCARAFPPYEHFEVACAGHPPPVVAEPGRPPGLVDCIGEPPLGVVEGLARRTRTISVAPGGVLAFYTDGLVERRGESLDEGLGRLQDAVRAAEPELVCTAVMHRLIGTEVPGDDVALIILRRAPAPSAGPSGPDGGRVCRTYPATLEGVAQARAFAGATAREWGAAPDVVSLVVTELATNALRHADSSYSLCLALEPPALRVEVGDRGAGAPVVRPFSSHGGAGRGLRIVEALATAWGVRFEADGPGKVVWADLPLAAPAP